MAWHQGHPLLQTVFSSIHIDKLLSFEGGSLDDVHFSESQEKIWRSFDEEETINVPAETVIVALILRAYCIGTIVTCQDVIHRVTSGNPIYYEDEDISTNTFGRDLFTRYDRDFVHAEVIEMLHEANVWITERYGVIDSNVEISHRPYLNSSTDSGSVLPMISGKTRRSIIQSAKA
jgi:N-alpha-acetyltransferase 35, NatC auxiliary subunit